MYLLTFFVILLFVHVCGHTFSLFTLDFSLNAIVLLNQQNILAMPDCKLALYFACYKLIVDDNAT